MRFETRLLAALGAAAFAASPALAMSQGGVMLFSVCTGTGVHLRLEIVPDTPGDPDRDPSRACHAAGSCPEAGKRKRGFSAGA